MDLFCQYLTCSLCISRLLECSQWAKGRHAWYCEVHLLKVQRLGRQIYLIAPVVSSSQHLSKIGNPHGKFQLFIQIEKLRKLQIISFSHLFHVGFWVILCDFHTLRYFEGIFYFFLVGAIYFGMRFSYFIRRLGTLDNISFLGFIWDLLKRLLFLNLFSEHL